MGLNFWTQYVEWVQKNPQLATDWENGLKWISYLATAYLRDSKNSLLISELVYKAGSLLTFLHDRVFEQAADFCNSVQYNRLEYFLGFLETSEVIFELAGRLAGGHLGKWIVVVVVQVVKTLLRLVILKRQRHIQRYPLIDPASRETITETLETAGVKETQEEVVTLSRSGRKIRTLAAAPARLADRDWNLPEGSGSNSSSSPNKIENRLRFLPLTRRRLLGEVCYVAQPLVHLGALRRYGTKSWRPWLMSAACDLLSHGFYGDISTLSQIEQVELWRRRTNLMLYLLRSPFYDAFTRKIIFAFLLFAAKNIPLGGKVAEIILAYLPHYRKIYSYLWSN